ncbi:hypothetical protein PRIPAC_71194 [Pristionchus pacificus]|uniref:BTB domain-containing protein n=1 Tax=Pristionchus pacificus TaxID=54126 RepID=A0A2A6BFW6_PRIPA|nr:hypothetical protein PRIPAC_71194 [Pristionchus pacificus]|eukprot:PDM64748.1 BTB domain-containing protein [Pristionchus pacificus]
MAQNIAYNGIHKESMIAFFVIPFLFAAAESLDCFSTTSPGGRIQCNNVEFCLSYQSYDGSEWRGCDNLGDCLRDIMRPRSNRIEQYSCAKLNGKKTCCCNTPYCNSSRVDMKMHPSLVISSQFTRLHLIMDSDLCSMSICEDVTSLIIKSNSAADRLSSLELNLGDEEGNEIFTSLITKFHGDDSTERIRIDAIMQLIFTRDDEIEITSERFLSWVGEYRRNCKKYTMRILIKLSPRSRPIRVQSITLIQTAALTVDQKTVPVSKELLALYSPYFETIFYQEFNEKQKGIYEVKEVNEEEFRWFVEHLHERNKDKPSFSTVDRAIVSLEYADRFGISGIHEQAFSFLKTQPLSKESLKEIFNVCSRFKDNDNMIAWILNQYKSEDELLELIHDCVPFVPANVIQTALKALKNIGTRSKEAMEKLRKEAREGFQLNIAIVHLRCYDEQGEMESERYFKLGLDTSKDFHWVRHLWPEIPSQYSIAEIDGERNARDNGVWHKVKAPKIVEVEAYTH